MEEMDYFSLEQFNRDLWKHLDMLNNAPFTKRPHNRRSYWDEERREVIPLPSVPYEYMERRVAKVFSDFHIRYDNAYYSVDKAGLSAQGSAHPGICHHSADFLQSGISSRGSPLSSCTSRSGLWSRRVPGGSRTVSCSTRP